MHELRYSYNASFLRDVFSQELDGVREAGVELLVQKLDDGELDDKFMAAIEPLIIEFIEENIDELEAASDEEEEG
jgi:hypothetical protein